MRTGRNACYRCYWKLERLIVPGLRSSQYAYYETVRSRLRGRCIWLDLGCGHQVFADWMHKEQADAIARAALVVGLDYSPASLEKHSSITNRVVADLRFPPIRDCSFDLITANMVVEHLENPLEALAEVRRMLKPGGLFIFHTPNRRNYLIWLASRVPARLKNALVEFLEGRHEEDVFPTWYRLNTSRQIRAQAKRAGFKLLELRLVNTSAATGRLGPLAVFELFILRLLGLEVFEDLRPVIVTVLENPKRAGPALSDAG